jgi:hypothetical protein
MPGSASSQQNTRTSAKARPSANVRAANLVANTPVLFRLPAIQDMSGRSAVKTEVKIEAPAASVVMPMSQPQSNPAPIRSAETPSQTSMATQPTPQRSWWEHWSSGVVLIVLLIALATASILALQGSSSKQNPKWIAESEKVDESLSGIETTSIDTSLASIQSQSSNPVLNLDSGKSSSIESPKSNSIDERKPAISPQPDESLLSTGSLLEADTSLAQPRETKIEAPSLAQSKPRETTQLDNKASVSLQAPIGKGASNRFDLELPESPKLGVHASPASSNMKKPAGASPDTWDSSKSDSKLELTQPSIQFDDPNSLTSAAGNGGSLMVPTTLTATQVAGPSIDVNTTPSTQPLLEASPPKPSANVSALGQGLMMTATPEWDREQLLKTYLTLREQAIGTGGNRYPQTTGVSAQNVQVGVPNNQVSNGQTNGFNAQQVPPAGNQTYTLQPSAQPAGVSVNSGSAPANLNVPTYR